MDGSTRKVFEVAQKTMALADILQKDFADTGQHHSVQALSMCVFQLSACVQILAKQIEITTGTAPMVPEILFLKDAMHPDIQARLSKHYRDYWEE